MQLKILAVEDYEMIHLDTSELFIAHKANTITYIRGSHKQLITMPDQFSFFEKVALGFRKSRRLLRLDKAIILPSDDGIVLFRRSEIWRYSFKKKEWEKCDIRLNCRNPMYNGVLRIPSGEIYVGEYGTPTGEGKRVFKSKDGGSTWREVYSFSPKEIRHIHCLAWDPFEKKIWVFTGDSDEESKVLCCDTEFQNVEIIGGGSQAFRSCHVMFSEKTVDWIMDSPLETVRQVKLDRSTKEISLHSYFAGPVWFAQKFGDGTAVAASAQEIGPSHTDKKLHLYATKDMEVWEEVANFKHDGWPKRYFRFGTITFSRGNLSCSSFCAFCEGVSRYDGKMIRCAVVE